MLELSFNKLTPNYMIMKYLSTSPYKVSAAVIIYTLCSLYKHLITIWHTWDGCFSISTLQWVSALNRWQRHGDMCYHFSHDTEQWIDALVNIPIYIYLYVIVWLGCISNCVICRSVWLSNCFWIYLILNDKIQLKVPSLLMWRWIKIMPYIAN